MYQEYNFTKEEQFCIRQLVKKGWMTRSIAHAIERDVLEVQEFIKELKVAEPDVRPAPKKANPAEPRIPYYDDPRSGEIGSRLLLEALVKYFEKRKAACP